MRAKPGANGVIVLFALTIATAVAFRNFLHLPPAMGMMLGLGYLQVWSYFLQRKGARLGNDDMVLNSFKQIERVEWDTLLFFFGIIFAVGGLGVMGYLAMASQFLYVDLGPTTANIAIGVLSAIVDNIPLMFAVLTMNPAMSHGQWLLVTLTAGVGGSLLSIGSAAGVALMGQARGAIHLLQPFQMELGHCAWATSRVSWRTCSSMRRCSEMNDQSALLRFINHEATAGLILVLAAALALIVTNVGYADAYDHFLELPVAIQIGGIGLDKTMIHWINDGLMAIFFFLVGLEIKREVLQGNLSSREQITLPAMAAIGGMLAPALIYIFFNRGTPETLQGWAIPAATDIAFALGALALVGSRVPLSLKVFLLTLATLDDLGAIVIIAIFYTSSLSLMGLGLAGIAFALLIGLNRLRIDRTAPYIFLGFAMWVFVLKSGVHATLAGVALAMTIPLLRRDGSSFIHALEEGLHPYVKFLILPLFAFANAGIPLAGLSLDSLTASLPLGIAMGLIAGKPLGIALAVFACVSLGLAKLPEQATWPHMLGVGCLAGIGFTMSLFIGTLAFNTAAQIDAVRLGVIAGSVVSTVLGLAILWLGSGKTSPS